MRSVLDPFRFVLIAVAGWMNQRQLEVIDCLREENRVLREQLGQRRLRLNDDQRRRLAAMWSSSATIGGGCPWRHSKLCSDSAECKPTAYNKIRGAADLPKLLRSAETTG